MVPSLNPHADTSWEECPRLHVPPTPRILWWPSTPGSRGMVSGRRNNGKSYCGAPLHPGMVSGEGREGGIAVNQPDVESRSMNSLQRSNCREWLTTLLKSKEDLNHNLAALWQEVTIEESRKLIDSMPDRLRPVIGAIEPGREVANSGHNSSFTHNSFHARIMEKNIDQMFRKYYARSEQ
uniref:Uncharacterized protein n=1 Tax=Timema genevievae TaxID=629358 RepID=A0A7R9PNL0_TIMGE|nr:unnamed protein product [Timema genevievae]